MNAHVALFNNYFQARLQIGAPLFRLIAPSTSSLPSTGLIRDLWVSDFVALALVLAVTQTLALAQTSVLALLRLSGFSSDSVLHLGLQDESESHGYQG